MSKCPLCNRDGAPMEKHHLKTKREGKETTRICRECHKAIHGLYTLTALRTGLDSVESLLAEPSFRDALVHIKRVRPGAFMRMRQASHRRGRN